jgi:hypothetical protein
MIKLAQRPALVIRDGDQHRTDRLTERSNPKGRQSGRLLSGLLTA